MFIHVHAHNFCLNIWTFLHFQQQLAPIYSDFIHLSLASFI